MYVHIDPYKNPMRVAKKVSGILNSLIADEAGLRRGVLRRVPHEETTRDYLEEVVTLVGDKAILHIKYNPFLNGGLAGALTITSSRLSDEQIRKTLGLSPGNVLPYQIK